MHLALLAARELDDAVDLREQRVVAAAADVLARVDARAALADEDRARGDLLTGEPLHAEPLGLGVAAVLVEPRPFLWAICVYPASV